MSTKHVQTHGPVACSTSSAALLTCGNRISSTTRRPNNLCFQELPQVLLSFVPPTHCSSTNLGRRCKKPRKTRTPTNPKVSTGDMHLLASLSLGLTKSTMGHWNSRSVVWQDSLRMRAPTTTPTKKNKRSLTHQMADSQKEGLQTSAMVLQFEAEAASCTLRAAATACRRMPWLTHLACALRRSYNETLHWLNKEPL